LYKLFVTLEAPEKSIGAFYCDCQKLNSGDGEIDIFFFVAGKLKAEMVTVILQFLLKSRFS